MGKQAKSFDERVLLTIEETTNDRGGGTVLTVSNWIVDGRVGKPQISKRERWQVDDGTWRKGAAKGLTAFDLLAILRDIKRIAETMQIPAADIQLALNEEKREPVAAGRKEAF